MLKKNRLLLLGAIIFTSTLVASALFIGKLGSNPTPIRVACVGDSITEGYGYPNELWKRLGSDYRVGNFGVGGSTISLKSYKPYINQSAFHQAKDFLPHIVVIMLGTNDAISSVYQHADSLAEDYKQLIAEFQKLPTKPQIWIVKPPPIFDNTLGPVDTNLEQGVIPKIEQVANELSLPLIDVYSALVNSPEHFVDGVHPTSEGAEVIANEVSEALNAANN
ncbi:MAG: GDSL-type esterase/lipase family protein [Candidatus Bathyarchaeota archaeon]|nr:GDSL-type esterase/lipase family protein [Candidatus Bathyarchaeota archaeon]